MTKKKDYHFLEAYQTPDFENMGKDVRLTIRGQNSNKRQAKLTLVIPKYACEQMVKRIAEIFKNDAIAAARSYERIKEAANV